MALVLIAAGIAGYFGVVPVPTISVSLPSRSTPDLYRPTFISPSEHEFIYIGSSTCGFANDPELPDVIERAKLASQHRAAEIGASFSAVWVSIDRDPSRGHAHLARVLMKP